MTTRFLIEYAGFIGGHYDFQTGERELPTSVENMHGDIIERCDSTNFVERIRVTQLDDDVPPRDITQDTLTALIGDWNFLDDPAGLRIFEQATDADAYIEQCEQEAAA